MKYKLLLFFILMFLMPLLSEASCPGDTVRFNNATSGCNSKTVSFTNTSVGTNTYFWDFGDNSTLADTSLLQNPPDYTYPTLGNYTATLIINKGLACSDTASSFVNLSFVTASFLSNTNSCISDSVVFNDSSSVEFGGSIASWKWNFGDAGSGINNTSTFKNPSHLFSAGNQTFLVKLVTTSLAGCKDSVTIGLNIQNLIIVNAGTDIISCDNNLTVNLSASILNAGGLFWSGSGAFSNQISLSPIYTPTPAAKASGSDTLILISTNNLFCAGDSDTIVILFNTGPTVNVGPDITVCKDVSEISISASSLGAFGGLWTTTDNGGTFTDSTSSITNYYPSSADTAAGFVILCRQTLGNGICNAARDSLTITFGPLPTVIIKTEDSACSGSIVVLNVTVSTGSGTWSTSGTGVFVPSNTSLNGYYYPSAADELAGVITLMFESGNNAGCQPVSDTLDVFSKPAPTAAFTSTSACVDDSVVFVNTSTSVNSIIGSTWTFGDLSLPSISASPSHAYSSCGYKNVVLTVYASNGCLDTESQNIEVYCNPFANFSAIGVCVNEATVFTNLSTVNSGSTISSSSWDFGNMAIDTAFNTSHLFPTGGSFPVSLTVTSNFGCIASVTQTLSLETGPQASFTASDAYPKIGQSVSFENKSTNAVSWAWDFGDSSDESNLQFPSHTYATGGVYYVCLVATDLSGCMDVICNKEIVATYPSVPSGFSPNGDGQNDVLYIYGGPFKKFSFKIFNNWGQLLFESTKQSDGWDGKFKDIDQAVGVYVYSVVGLSDDDTEYKISGDITLLR